MHQLEIPWPIVEEEIPEFIKLRGCINCDASKRLKEKTGREYGFDHELIVRCLLLGCQEYRHDLLHPFYDPEETIRLFNKNPQPELKETVRAYCLRVKEKFGRFYEKIGISIDGLLEKLR